MANRIKNVPFQQVVQALLDVNTPFSPTYLRRFSDLEGRDLETLKKAWPQVNATRKLALMEDLEDLNESDTIVFFDGVARLALNDGEPGVRASAIRLLWDSEDKKLAPVFLNMLHNDADAEVRAAAASALGQFVYLGELEEIPAETLHKVEDNLIDVANGKDDDLVRRRAVEALGFSGREEVHDLIQRAFDTGAPNWMASALFAMGRSYDQTWEQPVRRSIRHPKADVQLEAVRAAGELELESTRGMLLDLLEEEAQDVEIRFAAIWSLSQIGGEGVREALEDILEESDDEEEADFVENALDNLTLTETGQEMAMFDIDYANEEHLGKIVDLKDMTMEETEDEEGDDDDDEDEEEAKGQ
jgi:HEAT repeat protein